MVHIVEKLVQAQDKVPKDVFGVPGLISVAADATALIRAPNFEFNMWC